MSLQRRQGWFKMLITAGRITFTNTKRALKGEGQETHSSSFESSLASLGKRERKKRESQFPFPGSSRPWVGDGCPRALFVWHTTVPPKGTLRII